ncbi:BTB/POZ protein [Podospora fimiseda]|uniref:Elongin-C n=1 Tax=Podospora fimiseda TaxID=252190 RepID=A0AAN7BP72_9PEZI|nr:BTB/POZ protein [Podospora fimiseda]
MNGINGHTPEGKYITLISNDGFEYVVLREATEISPVLRTMLRSPFSEARTGRCHFPEIRAAVLEKVAEYFHYWFQNKDKDDVPDMIIPVEICLELLMAADFLGLDAKPEPTDREVNRGDNLAMIAARME